jgi:ketosteroid isomerase-like protein
MSLYSSGIVYYDVVPPLQFAGSAEVRRNFMRWFDEYDGPIGLETHELSIATSADVAFAHMLTWTAERARTGPRARYGYDRLFVADGQVASG